MTTGTSLIAQIRDNLDEQSASQWTNTQLRRWINRGLDDMARVTRHLRDRATISTVGGQTEYTVPTNILEIELAYFLPGDGQFIPLAPRAFESMDTVWGSQQNQLGGYPEMYTVWGFSPALKLKLFPVPQDTGKVVSMMVIRTATHLDESSATDSATLDFPDAWIDTLILYAEYCALRKDRDPRWSEAMQLYQAARDQMVVAGDYLNAPRDIIMDPYAAGGVPAWLAGFDY